MTFFSASPRGRARRFATPPGKPVLCGPSRIPADFCCCRNHGQGPAAIGKHQRPPPPPPPGLGKKKRDRNESPEKTIMCAPRREGGGGGAEGDRGRRASRVTEKKTEMEEKRKDDTAQKSHEAGEDLSVHCLLCGPGRSCSWLKITNS